MLLSSRKVLGKFAVYIEKSTIPQSMLAQLETFKAGFECMKRRLNQSSGNAKNL
jgi:hypothetical protein